MPNPSHRRLVPPKRLRTLAMGLLAFFAGAGADAAERIVSLNPSLTAILIALGAEQALVGVDEYSALQQPAVASLPTVGGLFNPNLETLVSLSPDLVVLVPSVEQRDLRRHLERLEIPRIELNPRSFEEVLESIEILGAAVDKRPAARQRIAEIRRARAEVEARSAGRPKEPTILVISRDPLFIVGGQTFINEMLTAVGADNLGAVFASAYPRVDLEWLIAEAPQVLLDASADPEPAAEYWSRYPSLPAVAAGRVVAVDRGEVTLPGPYLDHALRILSTVFQTPGAAEPAGRLPPADPSGTRARQETPAQ